jgi:hypothetical protein
MFIYIHILSYYTLFLSFNVLLSVMLNSLSGSLVKKDMDVNEHEIVSNITRRHKLK